MEKENLAGFLTRCFVLLLFVIVPFFLPFLLFWLVNGLPGITDPLTVCLVVSAGVLGFFLLSIWIFSKFDNRGTIKYILGKKQTVLYPPRGGTSVMPPEDPPVQIIKIIR